MTEKLTRAELLHHPRLWKGAKGILGAIILSQLKIPIIYGSQIDVDCRILMFHETTARLVESIIADNIDQGSQPVDMRTLIAIMNGETAKPKADLFCLTFDDGLRSQYDNALPILEKWKVPATFFVIGVDWEDGVHSYLSPEQKRELAQRNYEIGSHTLNHPPNLMVLRRQNLGAYQAEIQESRGIISDWIGQKVVSFCSPNSMSDDILTRDIAYLGYRSAVVTAPNQRSISTLRTFDRRYNLTRERVS